MSYSSRKIFLQKVAAVVLAVAAIPFKAFTKSKDDCYTGADVSGPFHRPNAPFRTDLTEGMAVKGELIEVRGTVYAADCTTPLPAVLLELWHSDPKGDYDMTTDKFVGHARIKTDSKGNYYFKSYVPGYYTDAGMDRPKHIHYIVSAAKHHRLITQLYFKGDQRLDKDRFVNQNDGWKRALAYEKNDAGIYQVRFDIYLKAGN